jgi:hypothetical protein
MEDEEKPLIICTPAESGEALREDEADGIP